MSRTIYVGNLPGGIREREVEDVFSKVRRRSCLRGSGLASASAVWWWRLMTLTTLTGAMLTHVLRSMARL